jgi:allantoate deiminase
VVTGIAAQLRYGVTVQGQGGPCGHLRHGPAPDALAGAAEMVLAVEASRAPMPAIWSPRWAHGGAARRGQCDPGEVRFTLDVRSGDAAGATARPRPSSPHPPLPTGAGSIGDREDPRPARQPLRARSDGSDGGSAGRTGHPAFRLVSGAGHDAMIMAAIAPPPCCSSDAATASATIPPSMSKVADVEAALAVMLGFIEKLGASYA